MCTSASHNIWHWWKPYAETGSWIKQAMWLVKFPVCLGQLCISANENESNIMLREGASFAQYKNTQNTPENCIDSSQFKWQQQQWWSMNVLFQIIKKIYTNCRAGVKYVFVFVFVFKYANICICICICIWKTTRWNICICICIWLAYLGVFDKYFSNTLLIFTL